MTSNVSVAEVGAPVLERTHQNNYMNSESSQSVKMNWIQHQLKSREDEFTEKKDVTIFLATWNVNGKKPGESLSPLLLMENDHPDIYAVGFQELDLSAENLLLGYSPLEELWQKHIESTLNSGETKYVLLDTKRVVGVFLLVFVKEECKKYITDVQTGLAAVGIMGMMGNKAGVAVRFNFHESSVCIVNSHLNAHTEGVLRRNQDFHDISKRILFTKVQTGELYTIFQHDYLFWIGDLNYRIAWNDAEVKQKIIEQDWEFLWHHDQLYQQIQNKAAFDKLSEGPLKFAPTYKYDVGTDTYDTSEKMRTPAWTDRVLFRGTVNQKHYKRHELQSSDHKPVSGYFEIKAKQVIAVKKRTVHQDIVRMLDRAENESQPCATIDRESLDFGVVKFGVPVCKQVVIKNSGKVLAKYQFIPKLEERTPMKPWLFINPSVGLLVPGESVTLDLTVLVDKKTAVDFNVGGARLDDILILALEHGNSFYLTITGQYQLSCFGSLLTHLVRFTGPVRSSTPLPIDSESCLSVPKELWRIIDFIYRKGMDTENLFVEAGTEEEMDPIRECLDNGEPFDNYNFSPYSMAETLVRFLDSLAEPIIPFSMFDSLLESNTFGQCKMLINTLNQTHYNCFFYIISFLRELLSRADKNKLDPQKLSALFSSVMIRRKDSTGIPTHLGRRRFECIEGFLNLENDLNIGHKN